MRIRWRHASGAAELARRCKVEVEESELARRCKVDHWDGELVSKQCRAHGFHTCEKVGRGDKDWGLRRLSIRRPSSHV